MAVFWYNNILIDFLRKRCTFSLVMSLIPRFNTICIKIFVQYCAVRIKYLSDFDEPWYGMLLNSDWVAHLAREWPSIELCYCLFCYKLDIKLSLMILSEANWLAFITSLGKGFGFSCTVSVARSQLHGLSCTVSAASVIYTDCTWCNSL